MKVFTNYTDHDFVGLAVESIDFTKERIALPLSRDERRMVAYDHFKAQGPHHCIAFLDAAYRKVLR